MGQLDFLATSEVLAAPQMRSIMNPNPSSNPSPEPQVPAQEALSVEPARTVSGIAPQAPVPAAVGGSGSGFFVDILVMVVIAALVSVGMSYVSPKWVAPPSDKLAIEDILVTVNFDAIVKEQMQALTERVRNGDIEASDMPARTEKFTLALMDKINAQASEGKIVMRADQVLAAPANIPDLTDKLRKELRSEGVMERRSEESSKSKDAK